MTDDDTPLRATRITYAMPDGTGLWDGPIKQIQDRIMADILYEKKLAYLESHAYCGTLAATQFEELAASTIDNVTRKGALDRQEFWTNLARKCNEEVAELQNKRTNGGTP